MCSTRPVVGASRICHRLARKSGGGGATRRAARRVATGSVRSGADARAALGAHGQAREPDHAACGTRRRVRRAGPDSDGRRVLRSGGVVLSGRTGTHPRRCAMAVLPRTSPPHAGRRGRERSVLLTGAGVAASGCADAHLARGDIPRSEPARGGGTVVRACVVAGSPLRRRTLGRRTRGSRETRFRARGRLSGAGVGGGAPSAQSALLPGSGLSRHGRAGSGQSEPGAPGKWSAGPSGSALGGLRGRAAQPAELRNSRAASLGKRAGEGGRQSFPQRPGAGAG